MAHFRFNLQPLVGSVNISNVNQKRIKVGNLLIYSCFFMYMMSMAVKGIVSAEMAFLKELWKMSYTETSLSNAFYFVIYGLVQVFLFIFMKKINMRKFLAVTIPLSAVCAILMGTSTGKYQMWAYFGLTGAFQAGLFSGCNQLLTACLPNELLSKGNRFMNLGYAFGTVLAYTLCGIFVSIGGWRVPYFLIGAIYLLSFVAFFLVSGFAIRFKHINEIFNTNTTDKTAKQLSDTENDPLFTLETKKKKVLFYTIDLILTFIITALYYCLMNNVTLFLKEVHGLSDDISIYVSIIAPITIAIGPMMTITACNRDRNFIRQALIFMLVVVPIPFLMIFLYDAFILIPLALTIAFVVLTNGVKSIAISIITFKMRKYINSGAYSAISNATASVAAGVMPVVLGRLLDVLGWQTMYAVTFAIALLLTVAILIINIFVTKADKKRHALIGENI